MLVVEIGIFIGNLGISIPGLLLKVLSLSGSQIWLTGNWVWDRVWVLIKVKLSYIDWAAVWGLDTLGARAEEHSNCNRL